jgi:TrmH family RNA methyltransferase
MMLVCMAPSRTKSSGARSPVLNRLRRVEGRHNPLVKELRGAFARGEPTADGSVAIEGVRILEEAIRSGLRFQAIFFSDSAYTKAERLLPQIGGHVETLLLPDALFRSVAPSETPQGVAALVRYEESTPDRLLARTPEWPLLAVMGIQDPGNLGTILRSAEALGSAGIFLGEGSVSPFNPKVVRASAGSAFRIPFARENSSKLMSFLRENRVRTVAASSHRGTPLHQANLTGRIAIFIGSEGAGLSRDLLSQIDQLVIIPHAEPVESLNAGVAASIVLYEASRQRS